MTDRGASPYSYSDFIPAKTRKKRKNKGSTSAPPSIAKLLPQFQSLLGRDEWFAQSTQIIQSAWRDFSPALESGSAKVLCLGLGSPSASQNARVQLAFLTETCKQLNIAHESVSIYDPVFSSEDTAFLEDELHMTVLSKNRNTDADTDAINRDANADTVEHPQNHHHQEQSWYTLSVPTICFMPHCDIELYDAIIAANWSRNGFSNLFMLGNSLQEYLDNKPTSVLEAKVPSLLRAAPIFENKPLPPSTAWPTAFNNTSVQYFRPDKSTTTFNDLFPEPEDSASSKEEAEVKSPSLTPDREMPPEKQPRG